MSDNVLDREVRPMNKTTLKKIIKILTYVVDNHEWCRAKYATCDLVPLCKGCKVYVEAVTLLQELAETSLDREVDG